MPSGPGMLSHPLRTVPMGGGETDGRRMSRWTMEGDEVTVVLDCSGCVTAPTDACDGCVVRYLCGREPDEAVVVDADEARALRLLGRAGLVPRWGSTRRTG